MIPDPTTKVGGMASVFINYFYKDQALRDQLETQLAYTTLASRHEETSQ